MQAAPAELWLLALMPAAASLAILSVWEHRRLRAAALIVENRILHIRPVVIDAGGCGSRTTAPAGGIEAFVSCFGILVGSTIIAFNQGGAQLKAVEIGCDFVDLTYGMGGRMQRARILHPAIDKEELAGIVERFRYETGVVPTITD